MSAAGRSEVGRLIVRLFGFIGYWALKAALTASPKPRKWSPAIYKIKFAALRTLKSCQEGQVEKATQSPEKAGNSQNDPLHNRPIREETDK